MKQKLYKFLIGIVLMGITVAASAADTVFYYTFDGTLDNSAGAAPAITNTSGLTDFYNMDADGVNGKALSLDGTFGSFLSIDQANLLDPAAEPFTVSAWVYNTSSVDHVFEHVILHQTNKLAGGTGKTRFYLALKGEGEVNPSETLKVGNFLGGRDYRSKELVYRDSWVHLACTGDPTTGEMKFYINGVMATVQRIQGGAIAEEVVDSVPFEAATHPFIIGKHHGKDDATWQGMIDDLFMIKKVITAEEIQQVAGIVPTYYAQVQSIVATSAQSGMNPENLVNYSGIDKVGYDLVHDWDYGKMFASAPNVKTVNFFMSLADTINLYSMELFNHSHFWPGGNGGLGSYFTNRGVKDFKVYYAATDNDRMDTVALGDALWTEVGAFELSRALDQQWNKGEKFMLGDIEANWIAIEGLTNHGGNKIGLDEIILWSREETPILAKSIDVSLESNVAYEGEMLQAMVSVSPVNSNEALTWEIVDATAGTSIAADGMITVGAPGTVKVVAFGELASDTAELTISAPKVAIDASQILVYMPFDSTYADESGNDHQFNLAKGDTLFSAGKFGYAADFDSTTLVSVEDSLFNAGTGVTFAAWVYHEKTPTQKGSAHTWLHQRDKTGQNPGRIHLEVLGGGSDAIGTFTSGLRNDASWAIDSMVWYHVANVIDTAAKMHYLYINGELAASTEMTKLENNWGEIVIGDRKQLNGPYAWGKMDELLITDEALTQDQVLAIMNLGVEKASTGYVPVQSITVEAPESVAAGDSIMATVTVVQRSNSDFGGAIWMLDGDTTNSTITQEGKLYAGNKAGTVTVAAKAADGSGVMGSANVVVYIPVSSIVVSAEGDVTSVEAGGTLQMMAMVSPENAEDASVSWEVVGATTGTSIDANGLLTAGEAGTVTVKATANDGSGVSGEVEIMIEKPVQVLLDYMDNQITYSSQDSVKSNGDLWLRDNPGDAGALKIVPVAEAPAGYDLTDSVLQVVIGDSPSAWWQHGLMAETDTFVIDTVNFRYLHVAVFVPGAITMQGSGGGHKSWLKDDAGVQKWNSNNLDGKVFTPVPGVWVDHVTDITVDTIHGKNLAHFEWFGFTTSDTSYVGSVILSGDPEPRFVNEVAVTGITLSTSIEGDSVREGSTITISADVMPAYASNTDVAWEVIGATAGTSISAEGVLTAGAPGTVTVKATAQDGSEVSATIDVMIYDKNTAIDANYAEMLNVYPNPSNGVFNISLPVVDNAIFKVFDTTGRQISSGTLNKNMTLDLSAQKSGIYFLEVNVNGSRTVNKLIVK